MLSQVFDRHYSGAFLLVILASPPSFFDAVTSLLLCFYRLHKTVSRYGALLDSTADMVCQASNAEGMLMGGLLFGGFSSLMAVLAYGGSLVRAGKLTVGALTSFATYSAMVIASGRACNSALRGSPPWRKLGQSASIRERQH